MLLLSDIMVRTGEDVAMARLIALAICTVGIITCIYFIIRISWVAKWYLRILNSNIDEYDKLPHINSALYGRPFCWDIEELKQENQ